MGRKDDWNHAAPRRQQFAEVRRSTPRWPSCCRCSTRACSRTSPALTADRADLVAILLTGIPAGIIPGFQNYTGPTQADMLRLNVAIPPTRDARTRSGSWVATWPASPTVGGPPTTSSPSSCGPSPALTYPLVAPSFTPDGAAWLVTDGTTAPPTSARSRTSTRRTTASARPRDGTFSRSRAAQRGRGSGPGDGRRGRRAPVRWCCWHRRPWRGRRSRSRRWRTTACPGPGSTSPCSHGGSGGPRWCTPPSTRRCRPGGGSSGRRSTGVRVTRRRRSRGAGRRGEMAVTEGALAGA